MPETPTSYGSKDIDAQFARLLTCTGCKTQYALAHTLGISQSKVSDALRRGFIPYEWLIKLVRLHGVNPDWIILGTGPKYLSPSDDPADASSPYECFPPVKATDAMTVRKVLRCFTTLDLTMEMNRRLKRPDLYPCSGE